MIYCDFKGKKLSSLGMGCMRLPTQADGTIDIAATKAMVDYAIGNGINYFDTAWGYHNGQSETVIGELLSAYPRDSYYIASKFPSYSVDNFGKAEEIFERQLEKCRVDRFDFYLCHNVCEKNIGHYLENEKYGDVAYLLEQKKNGRITHLGFSVHGSLKVMEDFLKKYGDVMEFCQIQFNYLDYKLQSAGEKLKLLEKYGIPVWVMEPVRGGKLATLDEKYVSRLKALRPDENAVAWAFRYIQSFGGIAVTLSGMSNMEQLQQNIKTFEESKPLNENEMNAVSEIVADMLSADTLPCTACRYCTEKCPMELDIPALIELYNEHRFTGGGFMAPMALSIYPEDKKPSACLGCRACEDVCPQNILISEMMADFVERLK